MIDLNELSPTDFEELCYDLLLKLGFKNINWRKGTGKTSSPSDGGRDIEASLIITDIDNKVYEEKWYIECKHYEKGVPADKISNAITWASAEKVDKLLIISSNFLSNSCKQYLEKIKDTASFMIKTWENKDLEEMLNNHIDLLHKYRITSNNNIVELMNPYHISYIKSLQYNTLRYFYNILERIDEKKREELLADTYYFFAKTKFKKPIDMNTKIFETITNPYTYENFKKICESNLETTTEMFIVNGIVNMILQVLFHQGNINNIDYFVEQRKRLIESMQIVAQKEEFNIARTDNNISKLIEKYQKDLIKLPNQVKEDYDLYNYFCNNVVAELLKEEYLFK